DVNRFREELKLKDLSIMKAYYRAPVPGREETRFKEWVFNDGKEMARLVLALEDVLDELKVVASERDKEPLRWQANYDYVRARLLGQMTYLNEYQSLLGQMRKEFPPIDRNIHNGWRLASRTSLQGDAAGKKYAKESRKLLE